MGKKGVLSSLEDIISAIELYSENYEVMKTDKAFEIHNIISVANFGCISNTDRVLIMSSAIDTITLAVSYIFTPQKLESYKINLDSDICSPAIKCSERWENFNQLLTEYVYTKPTFHDTNIDDWENENELFDVSITGFIKSMEELEEVPFSRFRLEAGIEYEIFEKLLVKACKLLKRDGRLLILAKPGWVLKAWALIHEFGLQLEYDSYNFNIGGCKHPNAIIWLRFVKKDKEINIEEHKRNINSFMKDYNIDRLFAHRNNLIFPYVELSYSNLEPYITLSQNLEYMQYFFSKETTVALAVLCEGYTACLVTPSIAQYAQDINKNVVLFERDNRFREKEGLKFVKYDLDKGLTKFQISKYAQKFNRVICDPPFDISLEVLARDILELIKRSKDSSAHIIFPESRKVSLINAMTSKGFAFEEDGKNICIEYAKPPKIVRVFGKEAIKLFKFIYIIIKFIV